MKNDTIEKYGILAIRVKIATSTSCSSEIERISKQENKLVHLRYLGYITAKFHKKNIRYPVVAEIGLQVSKSTQIRATLKLIVFLRFSKNFLPQPHQICMVNSPLGCFKSVENFVNFGP